MTSTSFNTGYSLNRNSSKVIQPPGGQTADIFGPRRHQEPSSISSASSQAESVDSAASGPAAPPQQPQQQQPQQQQPILQADDFKPTQDGISQPISSLQPQKVTQLQQQASSEVTRSPKKSFSAVRRNPITGEVYENPAPAVVRVRQPPGGRSSGIF